jgi:tripartite-type tricarboxylate transporter receptor subunit TctC
MNKRMISVLIVLVMALSLTATVLAEGSQEQGSEEYPAKSIEFLIPFGAGGSADTLGRALANAAEEYLGVSIVPVNRPGGGGGVMYQALANSAPDGYTVGWNSTSVLTSTNIGNVPFGYEEFEHVARIGYTSMPIAVRSDAPYQTLEEFIAAAESEPNSMIIGNAGTGSATHLTAVVFTLNADIACTHAPMGADRRVPALLGGECHAIVVPLPEIAPHVASGDANIIGFPTTDRVPGFEDVPTLRELGHDVVVELFRGISVPKGTPPEVIETLEDAFRQAAQDPEFQAIAEQNGFIVDFMGSEEFEPYLAAQDALIREGMVAGGLIDE